MLGRSHLGVAEAARDWISNRTGLSADQRDQNGLSPIRFRMEVNSPR